MLDVCHKNEGSNQKRIYVEICFFMRENSFVIINLIIITSGHFPPATFY